MSHVMVMCVWTRELELLYERTSLGQLLCILECTGEWNSCIVGSSELCDLVLGVVYSDLKTKYCIAEYVEHS